MKSYLLISTCWLWLTGAQPADTVKANSPALQQQAKMQFAPGEVIHFRVHYGLINAGKASMTIQDDRYVINGQPCYKIDVVGRSTGFFDFMMHVKDNWGTYFNYKKMLPARSYRNLEEGDYRKYEIVDFDQEADSVHQIELDKKTKKPKRVLDFAVPNNAHDMVSGYYYLRTLDYSKLKEGDIIKIDGYLDKEVYNFKIRYEGKEVIKTELGKIRAIKLSPIMPKNSLFDGKNSITVFLSDDVYKLPLKVRAKMFIGAVEVEITDYALPDDGRIGD